MPTQSHLILKQNLMEMDVSVREVRLLNYSVAFLKELRVGLSGFMRVFKLVSGGLIGLSLSVSAWSTVIPVDTSAKTRGVHTQKEITDAAVRQFASSSYRLFAGSIARMKATGHWSPGYQFSMPVVVRPSTARPPDHKALSGNITLQFDSSGPLAFPTAYQSLLQNVFNSAQAAMNAYFGPPAVGGVVHVANFDSTIGDRDAIAGGYYVTDNGSGVPEIDFPVYNSNETAAVNFIHCLLLAYLGPDNYAWDGWEEGLVRAVTMKLARTPGVLPSSLDSGVVANTLSNTYDIGATYDWNNQRALASTKFIAPNLRSEVLPVTGTGGMYLARYIMAGSAWEKLITEYPTFAASLNQAVAATPSLGSNLPGLISQVQTILNTSNPSNPTVEGLPFAQWESEQFALGTITIPGKRLFTQITPDTTQLASPDFGVFIVEPTLISSDTSGNETLLNATSYPIFWDDKFSRIFTSAQDQTVTITNGSGSVVPNFTDIYAGQPYRVTVEVPAGDQLTRTMVPAGAIATPANSTPNDFAGTVAGASLGATDTLAVQVSMGGNVLATVPVTQSAFGMNFGSTSPFESAGTVTLAVIQTSGGSSTTLMTRIVDKGPGALYVNLNIGADGSFTFANGLPAGISMFGLPIDPYALDAPTLLSQAPSGTLFARYNPSKTAYDLYPNTESPTIGHGYFVQLSSAMPNLTVQGRLSPTVSTSVALAPGWNMISPPLNAGFSTSNVRVVHSTDFPISYTGAVGTLIGTDFFQFVPGASDPITGVPEGGTFLPATSFNAGSAYFVRVLAPEGVSLVFDPPAGSRSPNGFASGTSGKGMIATPGWAMQVTATSQSKMTYAVIGEALGATNAEDPRFDSGIPPSVGGLQMTSIGGSEPLFRDMRALNTRQVYSLHLTGLVPGKPVNVRFDMVHNRVQSFVVTNLQTGKSVRMTPFHSWSFTPTSTTGDFSVTVTPR